MVSCVLSCIVSFACTDFLRLAVVALLYGYVVSSSWVRHGKAQKLTDAFAHLPDQPFDSATVVSPYLEDYGTQYEDALARRKFHMNSVDDYGNSLLVIAAQNGQMKIAQLLIRKGANPNHQNVSATAPGAPLRQY